MFEDLNSKNVVMFAIKHYSNPSLRGEDEFDEDRVTLSGADDFLLPGASESFERQLDALKGLIAEDPARVAQVVIAWINNEEGE